MKKKEPSAQTIFVIDFDGTISVNDSTTMLAEKYIPDMHRGYLRDIRAGKISVRKYIKDFVIVSAGTLQNVYYSLKEKDIYISPKKIISNQLNFNGEKMTVETSRRYFDQENGVNKAKVIEDFQKQNYHVIFIGDSISDFEGAKAADIVYAKKNQKLTTYLQEQGIAFFEYQNFDEIISHFQKFLI